MLLSVMLMGRLLLLGLKRVRMPQVRMLKMGVVPLVNMMLWLMLVRVL